VRRLERMLSQDLKQLHLLDAPATEARVIALQPRFQRPAESFSHPNRKELES
jgi:hypothetical protein